MNNDKHITYVQKIDLLTTLPENVSKQKSIFKISVYLKVGKY